MKRFLLIVILSNILLGQRITNSFFSELPELTKFPNNKFVLIQKSSYEESFGEFVEKSVWYHYAFLFDDKGRILENWSYDLEDYKGYDPNKLRLMYESTWDEENVQRYDHFYDANKKTDLLSKYVSMFDEDGFRLQWDKYSNKGVLEGREKTRFLDSNTLVIDIYNENGVIEKQTKIIYKDKKCVSKIEYNILKEHLTSLKAVAPDIYKKFQDLNMPDSTITLYNYSWENDSLLSMTEIKEELFGEKNISFHEFIFNHKKQLISYKVSLKEEKFGEQIVKPLKRERYSYFDSKKAYDKYNKANFHSNISQTELKKEYEYISSIKDNGLKDLLLRTYGYKEKSKQVFTKQNSESDRFIPYSAPPQPKKGIRPVYPKSSQKNGDEGTVVIQAFIGANGKLIECKVLIGVSLELDIAAIEAIYKTPFRPAKQRKKLVGAWTSIPVNFRLK